MPGMLDTHPYPWHLREARELHIVLCQLYPTSKGAVFVARQAGIPEYDINGDQKAYLVWVEVLDLGAASKKNRNMVTLVREQYRDNSHVPFLDALLNDEAPVFDSEPRGNLGAPEFLAGTDEIFEKEALLFRDDLTMPIGRIPWLIGVLEKLKALAPAVCRFQVSGGGVSKHGTGFRVADDLLLTNYHVLTIAGGKLARAVAEFGFDDDGRGGSEKSTAVQCDVANVRADKDDDWGIVRVAEPLPDTIPILRLSEAASPVLEGPAFIVQHPGGNRKRVGFVRNQIINITDRVIHYLTDTQSGSSGAPVFDDTGRLIAVHHAGGRPQEVAGKPAIQKNEGIVIPVVLEGLARAGIKVP
jgi:V8-like Glu-specific endopeptidase